MIYVVMVGSQYILKKFDAWANGAYEAAMEYVEDMKLVKKEINFNGDMVLWVE